jgi:DNA-binding GntR family transcriptional regulator
MEADAAFHRALIRAAKSRPLQEAMRPVTRHLHTLRDAYGGEPGDNLKTLRIHRRQTDAIRNRDLAALDRVPDAVRRRRARTRTPR